ncbi:glutathione S-transferase family protein [Ichthyobacterium seriolicida]|uniref:Lipoprotein n=1 Tax=Ichthyobacterium seriolicida TaxID=242600 RepID=A0A1J1DW70_9FLAO|nr:hypothetical protein [Ichthyobacterium seriolicida]BAV94111.1 hypothetical protein JBKA6_0098 [Ichthyobacterium seriolicida]
MKTNKVFKNILSLLTLGLVVFSCNKPNAETEIANIESFVFTKDKNSTTATNPTDATAAYKALFITKTPAPAYAALDAKLDADIKGDSIIKVIVPFNTKLTSTTPVTLKATITLKEKLGENVYLDGNKLDANALSFDHVITTKLLHSELKNGVSKTFEISKKEGDKVIAKKSFKVVFIHNTDPSITSALALDTAGTKVTGLGFTTGTSGQPNEKIKTGATAASPVYPTKGTDTSKDGSKENPIELTMTKNTEFANEDISSSSGWKFKVDVLTLPNGAFIDVTASEFSNDTTNHPPTDPTMSTGFTPADNNKGIQFRVVAQNGTSFTYYKLTFKNS